MVITPDNRTLIISESFAGTLTAFGIDADGSLSSRRVFADGLAPDGICLDADDHVANLDRLANGPRTGEILTLQVPVPGVGRS